MNEATLDQNNLNEQQIKYLNLINSKNQKNINILLKNIFKKTNHNSKWMMSPLFSRDFVQTSFYTDLLFLDLVDFFVIKKKIRFIKVKNTFLKNTIVKKYHYLNLKIEVSSNIKNKILSYINIFNSFSKLVICSIFMIFLKDSSRIKNIKSKKIILIETFFNKNLIFKEVFKERYHKEIYLKLPKNIKNDSYFFPTNLSILHIKKFLNLAQKEELKFIHPLDFLEIKDYFQSIFFIPFLGRINCSGFKYNNYFIDNLIKHHNFISYFNFSSFTANLNYNFLRALKNKKYKINLIIDWYENQIIDKGICLGRHKFFPTCKIKGHMGFLNDFKNIHYYTPSLLEKKLNALPDEVLCISKQVKKFLAKKVKFIKYKCVPAIRNKEIFNLKYSLKKKNFFKTKILVILSANQIETEFIFKILKKINDSFDFDSFDFLIKTHPNTKLSSFIKNNKNFTVTAKDFYKLLLDADIVVSGGTTATVEAQILNKKIIIIGSKDSITINPLLNVSEKRTYICYNETSFLNNINKLLKFKNKEKINTKLLNEYFVKYNKKDFSNFYK